MHTTAGTVPAAQAPRSREARRSPSLGYGSIAKRHKELPPTESHEIASLHF